MGAAVAGASLAVAANAALAGEDEHAAHMEHMDHSAHTGAAGLAEAARKCAAAGDACISHCLALFVTGDISVAGCAKSVYQMNAMCEALARLASANSAHLPALAKVCHDVCLDCEKECRKHEKEHAECKACAESCSRLRRGVQEALRLAALRVRDEC